MMKNSAFAALIFTAVATAAHAGITFGPVKGQAGQSIRLLTFSGTHGGTIQQTQSGRNSSGTIDINRERELVWTFRDPAPDGTRRGMVQVKKLSTESKTKIDGKVDKISDQSPLAGKMFAMSRPKKGDWKFELDGSVPLTRVHNEIDELTVYLKRDWFPAKEVNPGDSWEFDPAWVKLIIAKDLKNAQTIGTMHLRQVRTSLSGQTAYIDVSIRSTGADFQSDGSEASATIELSGQLKMNLKTMLDEELELKGTVRTTTQRAGESKTVSLPMTVSVSKSFVRGPN